MPDNEVAFIIAGHDHVLPVQGANLSAPQTRADGEEIKELENRFFIAESGEELLHFLHRRNFLHFAFGIWQVDHARWILFDDFVALRIAENSGHDGQVFLHRFFLDRFSAVGPLAELRQQVFQCYGTQFVQLDRADLREYRFERTAVESQRSGRVFCLPIQPAAGVGLKGHLAVLAVPLLEQAFQTLRFVVDVLLDAALWDCFRHLNRLCFADFPAVRAVAVADGDFIFSFRYLFDTCHQIPLSHILFH